MKIRVVLSLALALLAAGAPRVGSAWESSSAGTGVANAVAVDSERNVIATGSDSSFGDFFVVKYSGATGAVIWTRTIFGSLAGGTQGNAVAVDGSDDVIATGTIRNSTTQFDFIVVKLRGSNGTEVWRKVIAGAGNGSDEGTTLALTPAGSIYAAGRVATGGSSSFSARVLKLANATGGILWTKTLSSSSGIDRATDLAVDSLSNVLLVGYINFKFAIVKLARDDGGKVWDTRIEGSPIAVTVDLNNDVFALGESFREILFGEEDLRVLKLRKASGVVEWSVPVLGSRDGFFSGGQTRGGIVVSSGGNVGIVSSIIAPLPLGRAFRVARLRGTNGNILWARLITGSDGSGAGNAIALDSNGDFVVAGTVGTIARGNDFRVMKLRKTDGATIWARSIDGGASANDQALDVAIDRDGNVAAVGFATTSIASGADFFAVRLVGATGSSGLRCGNSTIEQGENCDDGNALDGDCCSSRCRLDSAGTPCTDDGRVCTNDRCNAGGTCTHPSVTNGTSCADADLCNGAETCQSGSCQSGTPLMCDDSDFCNGTETCDAGSGCQPGTPPTLSDGVGCTVDACDEVGDQVTHTPDNGLCDDSQFCNGAEICDLTQDCQPGVPPNPSDGVSCTIDVCDEGSDSFTHTPDDGLCDDSQFCNGAETCDLIQDCQPGIPPNPTDGVGCTVDACDEGSDSFTHTPNDGLCDDSNLCTTDVCDLNLDCINTPVSCDDSNACTNDSCDPGSGNCLNPDVANDTPCPDADLCNGDETCQSGTCSAGTPPDCDDQDVCTNDDCDAGSGCTNDPIVPCDDTDGDGLPDDADPCTTLDPAQDAFTSIIIVKNLHKPDGEQGVVVKGFFNPADPAIDPATNGVHFVLEDAGGTLYDVNIPGGPKTAPLPPSDHCDKRDGWKTVVRGSKTIWKYVNVSGLVPAPGDTPPTCTGSSRGVFAVIVKDLRTTRKAAFQYIVKSKLDTLPHTPAFPVTLMQADLAMGAQPTPGVASPEAILGKCAESLFSGGPVPVLPPKPFCKEAPSSPPRKKIICKGL